MQQLQHSGTLPTNVRAKQLTLELRDPFKPIRRDVRHSRVLVDAHPWCRTVPLQHSPSRR